ncbi:hypothetical protein HPG69_003891 [Diceros bicornis minor]|uniref:Uncharacterized protein n=1 Tax=Diceros bicornis minor TaxID=77932 RepID=A0A7J7EU96_DICBM|nr:hypothetical protein HPG69_003891 [Diceros bicornis minor]
MDECVKGRGGQEVEGAWDRALGTGSYCPRMGAGGRAMRHEDEDSDWSSSLAAPDHGGTEWQYGASLSQGRPSVPNKFLGRPYESW